MITETGRNREHPAERDITKMQRETGELQKINVAVTLLIEEPKNNHKENKEES